MISWLISRLTAYLWPIVAAVGVSLVLAVGVQTKRVTWAKAETKQVQAAWTLDNAQRTQVALDAATNYRKAEAAYAANVKDAQNALSSEQVANARTRSALESANRALAASDNRLRDALASYASGSARTPDNPGPSDSERAIALGKLLSEAIAIDSEAVQLETELATAAESASADVRALLKAWPKGKL